MPGQVDAEDYSPFRPPGFSLGAYAAAEHLAATAPSKDVPYQPRHEKHSDCGGNRQFIESRHEKPFPSRVLAMDKSES